MQLIINTFGTSLRRKGERSLFENDSHGRTVVPLPGVVLIDEIVREIRGT